MALLIWLNENVQFIKDVRKRQCALMPCVVGLAFTVRPFLSDRLVHDIRCFLGSLRAELQDDEALAMGMMLVAYQLIPRDLSIVKNTMLGFFARIKEQVLDNIVERRE